MSCDTDANHTNLVTRWHELTTEGPWDEVCATIGKAHEALHEKGVVRIQSDIRIGTRTDKDQSPQDKIDAVMRHLSKDEEKK